MISADLSNVGGFIGAVKGTLQAVEDPRFKGDFVGKTMDKMRTRFYIDSLAARDSANLRHMYEWGSNQGEVTSVRLFKLTKTGRGQNRALSFQFLPSTVNVPLPDVGAGYSLRRHKFVMKSLVMETQSSVTINVRDAKRLFIPSASGSKGFITHPGPVTVNPGGSKATGSFSSFWVSWFESIGPAIVAEQSRAAEEVIAKTGIKVIRHLAGTVINGEKVGGRFAEGNVVSIGFVNGDTKKAKKMAEEELGRYFDEREGEEE